MGAGMLWPVLRAVSGTRATTAQSVALQRWATTSRALVLDVTVALDQSSPPDSSTVTKACCPS